MIYLTRNHDIAACESEAGAQRLEREGYTRVPYAAYKQAWRLRDAAARMRLEEEGERRCAAQERARAKEALVYPKKG